MSGLLLIGSAHDAKSQDGIAEVAIQVVIDNVTALIKTKLIDKHRTVLPVEIDGQFVYVLPLVDYDGSRATDNFSATWSGFRNFRAYIVNCPDQYKTKVTFVLKGDKRGGPDSTRFDGREIGEGDIFHLDSDGNYLANRRGINPKDGDIRYLLEVAPHAAVILVPEGMSRDHAIQALKDRFDVKK